MENISLNKNILESLVNKAGKVILSGGIVVLPFDTTYGLVCDPRNEAALHKIFTLKQRKISKTIGIAISSLNILSNVSKTDAKKLQFIKKLVPGKFTFVLPIKININISSFCIKNNTVGIRIPDNQLIIRLAKKCGGIIAQTSANKSGRPICDSIYELKKQFKKEELGNIDLIIDSGTINSNGSSTIYDLTGQKPVIIERNRQI